MTDIMGDMHAYAKESVLRSLCKASARSQARLTAKILSVISSVVCTPFYWYSGDLSFVRPVVALSVHRNLPLHLVLLAQKVT
jgi:hypothetical protein